MTKTEELKKTLEQLRRDLTAANRRRRELLISGGDTTAVMGEILEIDRRVDEAERAVDGAMQEEQQKTSDTILASATELVGRLRALSDARIDALKPPPYPKESRP